MVDDLDELVEGAVDSLNHLQDALEYIAARVCEEHSYNYIQIRCEVLSKKNLSS